jgi:YVTN family beta-propeller protein
VALTKGDVNMKTIFGYVAVLLLVFAVNASAQDTKLYKQIAKFNVGGEGGWDYVTYDPARNSLFIAHSTSIFVVDAATGKKLGEFPAQGAHGVALVPGKNIGFATNGRAGTVTVFDTNTLKPTSEIKAGENPDAIIYDHYTNRVLVMNGRSKDMMVIDPDSQKVEKSIPLGGKLEFAAADKGHIYVNVEDTGEIATVDTKSWTPGARWKLDGCEEPSGLAIDEKDGTLFSVCGNSKMYVVNTASGKTIATVATGEGTDAAAYDPTLKLAFASNGDGTISVVRQNKDGKWELAENVPTQKGARTMALDPKSHKICTVTAEFGEPVQGQRRPPIKPGTFAVLVFGPNK